MSWKAEYIILIMISTLIDYLAGIQIFKSKTQKRKTFFLIISIITNLGLLFAFKYFNFFSESVRAVLQQFSIQLNPITLKVLLPVGISFYTFQTLSYTIDVYRGKIKPEKHLGIFAVYVSFFPQLVAGPIERAKNLLPQFYEKHDFDYKRITNGLKLMLWGFFKKVVIADRLAIIVDIVYNNVDGYTGLPLILATFFFAFQIYCDFSGYSDIAIGSAQIMGFRLMDNFKRPYFSRSIAEFWRRWHISLSSWFKDYVYIPLGGNKLKIPRWSLNIMVVFIISGLWHGANWTFIIWGALHGIYIIMGRLTKSLKNKIKEVLLLDKFPYIKQTLQVIITFTLVSLGWILFRANSLSDAIYIYTHLLANLSFKGAYLGVERIDIFLALFFIGLMEFVHLIQEHVRMREFLSNKPLPLRWGIYITIIISILLFGVFNNTEFIYFQF